MSVGRLESGMFVLLLLLLLQDRLLVQLLLLWDLEVVDSAGGDQPVEMRMLLCWWQEWWSGGSGWLKSSSSCCVGKQTHGRDRGMTHSSHVRLLLLLRGWSWKRSWSEERRVPSRGVVAAAVAIRNTECHLGGGGTDAGAGCEIDRARAICTDWTGSKEATNAANTGHR